MSQKRILVVDDDPVVLKALSIKLKAAGYDVLAAIDGSAAVAGARTQKPDLILLDLSFPPDVAHGGGVSWDGFLIMTWLKRLEEAAHIPIIVITGSGDQATEARAKAVGATAFFRKPIQSTELLDVIRQTLQEPRPVE